MKKGFSLLETLIVISFLCVALLLLYNNFKSIYINNNNNIIYDDAANIYKIYYIKEYLKGNNRDLLKTTDINEIIYDDLAFKELTKKMNVNKLYISKYEKKDYEDISLNNYVKSLVNNEDYDYRLIGEFLVDGKYYYASIGVKDEE